MRPLLLALLLGLSSLTAAQTQVTAIELASGIPSPWGLAITPSGEMFISSRDGDVYWRDRSGELRLIDEVAVSTGGQGGLLDLALHPDFTSNGYVYASASYRRGGLRGTALLRARFADGQFSDWQTLLQADNLARGGRHFGSRLVFDNAGHLFMSLGDRGDRDRAQDLSDHVGTMLRLDSDGRPIASNPFPAANPAVYSYGHRNIQGMALHPTSGKVWTHEHGPRGGDEVNLLTKGANYGWPLVTYGVAYSGFKIGEGTHKEGTEQPLWYWVPSIAPSGMAFYEGDVFPEWQGDLLVGALAGQALVHLEVSGDEIVSEQRMLEGAIGRVRTVQVHQGEVYLLTDSGNGKLYQLQPKP